MRKSVLLLMLAACGDDGVRHTPDAAPHDGPVTIDSPVDAGPTPVSITTTANGTAVAGVHVYFLNADSSVVLATTTDATGTASAVMAAGGSVTAINPYTPLALGRTDDELDTFMGVKPGDHLQLALTNNTNVSISVTVIADMDPAATTEFVYSPCGSAQLLGAAVALAAPRATFGLTNCGATTNFLVVSFDQAGSPLNSFFAAANTISDGATIDLTGKAFAAVPTRGYTYTSTTQSSFSFEDRLLDTQGAIYTFNGNAGSAATTYPVPTFTNASDLMQTSVFPGGSNEELFIDWGPYAATYTTDAAARMLPLFANSGPTFDPATHTFSFGEGSGGVTPDFVFASVSAVRQADGRGWHWRVTAPHATSIVFPTLPTDVYDFNITATDNPNGEALWTGKVPGGYDAVRPYVLSFAPLLQSGGQLQTDRFMTGTAGSVTLQHYALLVKGRAKRSGSSYDPFARGAARALAGRHLDLR